MEHSANFFTKLRKLAVTMETETAKLKVAFENRKKDDDGETTARAMRDYHEMNCDVRDLKGQVQHDLAQQSARQDTVRSFIQACTVMEQRVTEDIQTLREHWEKYGYQHSHRTTKVNGHGQEPEDEAGSGYETKSTVGEEGHLGEEENHAPLSPPPSVDPTRTPQLSDFGLSEMQLKRILAKDRCLELAPMPEIRLPNPSLDTPTPPPMPITPRCALRMDDDELQMPQMSNFGIMEPTLCLDDFTMNLPRKKIEKTQRPPDPEAPISSHTKDNGDPESPARHGKVPSTPEVPAFQTPYMNRLLSTRKGAKRPYPTGTEADDEICTFDLSTACNRAAGSEPSGGLEVPKVSGGVGEDKQMPEMPVLESTLGKSLQLPEDAAVHRLDLDGPTQEISLGIPHTRGRYRELSTPEMPELSSVTLDICKLVSQAQLKKTSATVTQLHFTPEKDKCRAASLSAVTESEFQSLPAYLRHITLHDLNQAVRSINAFTTEHHGEQTEFGMEELQRITKVKTPLCVLCLTELERLKCVGGVGNDATYKLITNA